MPPTLVTHPLAFTLPTILPTVSPDDTSHVQSSDDLPTEFLLSPTPIPTTYLPPSAYSHLHCLPTIYISHLFCTQHPISNFVSYDHLHLPIVLLISPSRLHLFPSHIVKLCTYPSGKRPWMQNTLLLYNVELGSWFLLLLPVMLSHANGCTLSSITHMV